MAKVNCREENMCIFCKYWLGKRPKTNFHTGETILKMENGMCSLDDTNQYHKSIELCHKFKKDIIYL